MNATTTAMKPAMTTATAAALAALALLGGACSGGHQVVLELSGAPAGTERFEIALLEPLVLAKEQRHNDPDRTQKDGTTLETVFYMAERSRTSIAVAPGEAIDGFQLEIREAGGPYVPLVAALGRGQGSAADQLLALGVYDPASISAAPLGREHVPAAVSPVGDVTIFPLALEPVTAASSTATAVPVVHAREVLQVACAGTGAPSGVAWRRTDGAELRVLLPLDGKAGADRLEPPDLDCDAHSPGRAGVVRTEGDDQRDCDDTAAFVHAGVREQCSALDEDCNPQTTLSVRACSQACTSTICACDDSSTPEVCLLPATAGICKVPAMSASGGSALEPCDSVGTFRPPGCAAGCEVLLAWAPEGLDLAISDEMGGGGVGIGKWAPISDGLAYLSVRASRAFTTASLPVIVRIKSGGVTKSLGLPLQLQGGSSCTSDATFECPILP